MAPAPPPVRGRVVLSSPVRAALAAGHPVVALESTIIAHGLPYPDNLACARALEAAVRSAGAIPATVAVLAGVPHAGLTDTQLTALAAPDAKVAKLALRDIPRAVAGRLDGATTVSATMHIASQAGIAVFATGGVGGVHRGPLDVSQDLLALSRIPVLVVSAGVKSVLDVRSTLEALEAMSVPVFVWRAERFPAFYARDSGLPAPAVMGGAVEVAGVWQAARRTSAARGMLLAVPPADQDAAAAARVEKATQRALKECEERSVAGADVTPFLLRRIAELSGGDSVRANVALAVNNARVAGEVAVEIARMSKGNALRQPISANASSAKVIVAGVAALDVICTPRDQLVSGTSTPGRVARSLGGVACNVARAAARSGARVELLAAVGDDADGRIVRELLASARVSTRSVAVVQGGRTPTYCAMHDGTGDLQVRRARPDRFARSEMLVY